jgi:hypothetical protein
LKGFHVARQRKNEPDNKDVNYIEICKIANHLAELAKLQSHLIQELKKQVENPKTSSGSH